MGAPTLVVLVGATASGKTDLAIQVAERHEARVEIVGLDSRQLYRRLDVGTGKPTPEQRSRVRHHLLDCLDPSETFDAARYRSQVEALLPTLFQRGVVPLFVGGAGFYLRALREGFYDLPGQPELLAEIRAEHEGLDVAELHRRLEEIDPESAARLHLNDRYRVGRALEIHRLSGRTATQQRQRFRPRPILGARFEVLHLRPERGDLHARIAIRTRDWLRGGWAEEVERLLREGYAEDCPGLSILGYREVVRWVRGEMLAQDAERAIVIRTRRYARQQETWFRKEQSVWRGPLGEDAARALSNSLRRAAAGGGDLDTTTSGC